MFHRAHVVRLKPKGLMLAKRSCLVGIFDNQNMPAVLVSVIRKSKMTKMEKKRMSHVFLFTGVCVHVVFFFFFFLVLYFRIASVALNCDCLMPKTVSA